MTYHNGINKEIRDLDKARSCENHLSDMSAAGMTAWIICNTEEGPKGGYLSRCENCSRYGLKIKNNSS